MLDVVGNTEPGGFGGINAMLAQLRGETRTSAAGSSASATCAARSTSSATRSISAFDTGPGYWWPRIADHRSSRWPRS